MIYPLLCMLVPALMTIGNTVVIWIVWRELKRSHRKIEQNYAGLQRQEKEIAQHRYSIALLSQIQKNKDVKEQKAITDKKEPEAVMEKTSSEILAVEAAHILVTENDLFDPANNNDVLEFVKKSVRNNQIALAQQPIVLLPDRKTSYYEIFSRIHVEGQGYIPANRFMAIAKNNNLMGKIDNLLLLRCLQLLKDKEEKQENAEFFINTNAQTFIHKDYLGGLVKFLVANPRLSSKLIFEISQHDWINLSSSVKNVLDNLVLLGCRFSMDQVTILSMDIVRIMKQNISFVKLDAQILINEIEKTGSITKVKQITDSLGTQRIGVIIEKVENEKDLVTLRGVRADFGQGYLFGPPVVVS
jgi:cyclic-di-GMP phosphodiesterase TipF (flagellum assembly factor)